MNHRHASTILFVSSLVLAIFVYSVSSFNKNSTSKESPAGTGTLGQLTEIEGDVSVRSFGATEDAEVLPESTPLPLTNMQLVKTGEGGLATLDLKSGYEIRLAESSQVLVEALGPKEDDPTYLHILSGDYDLVRAGQRGQVLVLQNRGIFFPENKAQPSAGYDIYKSITQHRGSSVEDLEAKPEGGEFPILPRSENADEVPATLENDEIDRILTGYRVHFERCQTNALREKAPSLGELLVGIKISPKGNIEEARVISSTLKNTGFENCVLSVFERAKLRAFNGPAITRSYPLVFE